MKEEKEKRIDTKKEKEIKTEGMTTPVTEEPADALTEKKGAGAQTQCNGFFPCCDAGEIMRMVSIEIIIFFPND